jgi:ketosteroid isomerase-like protein
VNCLKKTVAFLVSLFLVNGTIGGVIAAVKESEKVVVAKIIRDSICWALTKDRALQESTMAHDKDLFVLWTDSNSTVSGWDQYVKLFDTWMDPRFKATVTEIREMQIHFSRSGTVAWYSATLDDLGEWDGKPTGARDIRWTGVLEKRAGKWVIVQMHGSEARDKVLERAKQ